MNKRKSKPFFQLAYCVSQKIRHAALTLRGVHMHFSAQRKQNAGATLVGAMTTICGYYLCGFAYDPLPCHQVIKQALQAVQLHASTEF